MVITYFAEAVEFRVVRADGPEPKLEGFQRVSIGIDNHRLVKIFPRATSNFWTR